MTHADVTHADPQADLTALVRTTASAFEAVLHALLDRDKHAARQVLRGSAARRLLVSSTKEDLRTCPAPTHLVSDQLRLVGDLGRIDQLVDHLARRVVDDSEPLALSPTARLEITVLLDAGGRRLHELAEGAHAELDHHRRSGSVLFEVADRACHDPSLAMRLCAGLAVTLLQASRHASHAV